MPQPAEQTAGLRNSRNARAAIVVAAVAAVVVVAVVPIVTGFEQFAELDRLVGLVVVHGPHVGADQAEVRSISPDRLPTSILYHDLDGQ